MAANADALRPQEIRIMRRSLVTALAAACAVGVPLAASLAASANTVGNVTAVKQNAYGTPPDATRAQKRKGDGIAFQEQLETLKGSALLVRFADGSALTLGASSKLLVDAFVYDPNSSTGKALINIPAGTLRYITGAMPKGQTTIETPTATLVLRGTNVTVGVDLNGDTKLYVREGSVGVHDKITGDDSVVGAGSGVDIGGNGIGADDREDTGDPVVNDGLQPGGNPNNNSTPEQRRGNGDGQHNSTRSNSGKNGGGNSGGGSTPG
jgi:hypothetical protein